MRTHERFAQAGGWLTALALVCVSVIALASPTQGREDRRVRENRRMRSGAPALAFFEAFPVSGRGTTSACSTTAPTGARGEQLTFTRASVAECYSNDGQTLTQMATDQIRVSSGSANTSQLGPWTENAAINSILNNRDLSTGSWTKTNMTCTKNAVGMRNDANSASTCTATAANATVCQTLVFAAAARSSSWHIKAGTVTDAVTFARDAATYSADVASQLSTTVWKRAVPWDAPGCAGGNCIVLTSTLTGSVLNPQVCLKLAASGDSVIIDFVQDEAGSRATSPIETAAVAVPRANEVGYFTIPATVVRSMRVGAQMNGYSPAFSAAMGVWKDASNAALMRNLTASVDQNYACDNVVAGANNLGPGTVFPPINAGVFTVMQCDFVDATSITWSQRGDPFVTATATNPVTATRVYLGGHPLTAGFALSAVTRDYCVDPVAGRCTPTTWDSEGSPIITIGDSISYGVDQIPTRWVYVLGQALKRPVYNLGHTGISAAVCLSNWRTYGAGHGYTGATVLCGVNSILGDATAADTFATLQTLYDEIRAAGLNLTIGTILPFGNNVQWSAGRQTQTEALNALILDYCTTNGVDCVDFYNSALRDGVTVNLAAAYDSGDGIHPNAAGGVVMSGLWEAATP